MSEQEAHAGGAEASCFSGCYTLVSKTCFYKDKTGSHHAHQLWRLPQHEETHSCSKQGHVVVMSLKSFFTDGEECFGKNGPSSLPLSAAEERSEEGDSILKPHL